MSLLDTPPVPATTAPGAPDLLERMAELGARSALVGPDGERLSYGDLADRAADLGVQLGPGRRLVLIEAGVSTSTVVAYLAALAGGHVVALATPGSLAAAALARSFDPDVTVDADGRLEWRRTASAHDLHPDLALLLSTSGSTGVAKAVRLSRENVASNATAIADYLALSPDDRAVTSLPLGYCYGLSVLNSHLAVGATTVLEDRSVVDPCFWGRARSEGITSLAGVPHTFALLERDGRTGAELPTLRTLTQAGGRLDPDAVVRWARRGRQHGYRFFVMYGQTEATARMAFLPPELAERRPTAIGRAVPGGRLRIEPVEGSPPEVGELVYSGPNVMLGYATDPADLARGRDVEALRTGDLARQADDGLFEICGRRARFVKVVGLRVDLDQLERRLGELGWEAVCAGADEQVVVATTAGTDAPQVRAHIAAEVGLPPGAIVVVGVDELPRLANGKPDLVAVAALGADAAAATDGRRDDGPTTVAELFGAVLGVEVVDPAATFVSVGGDSLSYVEASLGLERLLGRAPDGWHTMTVGELEALPLRHGRAGVETSVALRAAAILAVVAAHAGLSAASGGGHLLLAVAGCHAARFAGDGGGWSSWRRTAAQVGRVALPAVGLLAVAALVVDGMHPSTPLLASSYVGEGTWRYRYWFIEALALLLVVVAALRWLPPVRRAERRAPLVVALVGVAVALALRDVQVGAEGWDELKAHAVAWLLLLGWAVERARTTPSRLVVSAVAVVAVAGWLDGTGREAVLAAGVLVLLWVPRVPLPRRWHGLVRILAAASLAIYLTHWLVLDAAAGRLPAPVAAAVAVAVGVVTWWSVPRAAAALGGRLGHRRRRQVGAGADRAVPPAVDAAVVGP